MDSIKLRGLRAYGHHGVDAIERERRQPIDIDLCAEIDLTAAAHSDDLSDTLNYAELHQRLVRIVATTSYALLERLAADLVEAVLRDRRVVRAAITLSKPGIVDGATPCVTLERTNPRSRG